MAHRPSPKGSKAEPSLLLLELLPLRYPYLLIDRVEERSPERVRALKNVTHNEWFFVGHFPGRPVMPGTLLLEGMAQTAGILLREHERAAGPALGFLVGVDKARFRRQVLPGDRVIYEAKLLKAKRGLLRAEVVATVEGEPVAEAIISLMSASPAPDSDPDSDPEPEAG